MEGRLSAARFRTTDNSRNPIRSGPHIERRRRSRNPERDGDDYRFVAESRRASLRPATAKGQVSRARFGK